MKKKYRVDFTAAAEADIAEIRDYIARDNPDAATTFILHPEEQIGTLERYPERCPLIPENDLLGRPTATSSSAIAGPFSRSSARG